jgi:hypothetical protein
MLKLRMIEWLLVLGMFFPQAMAAQTFDVLVLDALNGKPQAGVKVNYFCSGRTNELPPKSVLTNSHGIAEVPYRCSSEAKIEINALAPLPKEQCGEVAPLTPEEISSGVVSNPSAAGNIWCPTRVSKKLKPTPKQIIIFVKKPTWWQSHVAG